MDIYIATSVCPLSGNRRILGAFTDNLGALSCCSDAADEYITKKKANKRTADKQLFIEPLNRSAGYRVVENLETGVRTWYMFQVQTWDWHSTDVELIS